MKNNFITTIYPDYPDENRISEVPVYRIDSFHWEQEGYSRPETYVRFFGVKNDGFYAKLWSFEENIKCTYTERDDRIWFDSCLEVFLAPVTGDPRYFNIETNPNGAFLCQFGSGREGRVFTKELTDLSPTVTPFTLEENGKTAWGNEVFIPVQFISRLYGIDYRLTEGEIKGNFYKCADEAESPHFGALFPAGSAALGFHNPSIFGTIKLEEK